MTVEMVEVAMPISLVSRNGFVDIGRIELGPLTGLVVSEPTLLRKGLLEANGEETRSVFRVSSSARQFQLLSEDQWTCICLCDGIQARVFLLLGGPPPDVCVAHLGMQSA